MSTLTKLTPAQKSAVTRAKNKAKNNLAKNNAKANKIAQNKLKSKQIQTPKVLVKSGGHIKIEKRINDLKSVKGKRDLTMQETGWLINAQLKLEDRSLSQLYAYMKKVMPKAYRVELVGTAKIPTFNDFKAKAPNKLLFSKYDIIRMLTKFNKKEIARKKLTSKLKTQATNVKKK